MSRKRGAIHTSITRHEFFEHAKRDVTEYDNTFAGTATGIADLLEEMFDAADNRGGFMFSAASITPHDHEQIVDLLVPELQRRGRFRTEYEGATLRENLNA